MCPDVFESTRQGLHRERIRFARADHFAAEAKTAIDRADMSKLEKHAVRIAMNNTVPRTMSIVADRISKLLRTMDQFRRVGNDLAGNRIRRIGAVDQLR